MCIQKLNLIKYKLMQRPNYIMIMYMPFSLVNGRYKCDDGSLDIEEFKVFAIV